MTRCFCCFSSAIEKSKDITDSIGHDVVLNDLLLRPDHIDLNLERKISDWQTALNDYQAFEEICVEEMGIEFTSIRNSFQRNPNIYRDKKFSPNINTLAGKLIKVKELQSKLDFSHHEEDSDVRRSSCFSCFGCLPGKIKPNETMPTSINGVIADKLSVTWANRLNEINPTQNNTLHQKTKFLNSNTVLINHKKTVEKIKPKWPDFLIDMYFDVIKVNKYGHRMRRIIRLNQHYVLSIKNCREITKFFHYRDIRRVWLENGDTIVIILRNKKKNVFLSPIAPHILQQLTTRVQMRMSIDKADFTSLSGGGLGFNNAKVSSSGNCSSNMITADIIEAISEENTIDTEAVMAAFARDLKERTIMSMLGGGDEVMCDHQHHHHHHRPNSSNMNRISRASEGVGLELTGMPTTTTTTTTPSVDAVDCDIAAASEIILTNKESKASLLDCLSASDDTDNANTDNDDEDVIENHNHNPFHINHPKQQQDNYNHNHNNKLNKNNHNNDDDNDNSNEVHSNILSLVSHIGSIFTDSHNSTSTIITDLTEAVNNPIIAMAEEEQKEVENKMNKSVDLTAMGNNNKDIDINNNNNNRNSSNIRISQSVLSPTLATSSSTTVPPPPLPSSLKLLSFKEGMPEYAVQAALQKLIFDPMSSEGNTRNIFINGFKSSVRTSTSNIGNVSSSSSLSSAASTIAVAEAAVAAPPRTLQEVRHFIDGMHEYILTKRGVSLALLYEREKQRYMINSSSNNNNISGINKRVSGGDGTHAKQPTTTAVSVEAAEKVDLTSDLDASYVTSHSNTNDSSHSNNSDADAAFYHNQKLSKDARSDSKEDELSSSSSSCLASPPPRRSNNNMVTMNSDCDGVDENNTATNNNSNSMNSCSSNSNSNGFFSVISGRTLSVSLVKRRSDNNKNNNDNNISNGNSNKRTSNNVSNIIYPDNNGIISAYEQSINARQLHQQQNQNLHAELLLTTSSSLQFLKDNDIGLLSLIDNATLVFLSYIIFIVVEESIFLPIKANIISLLPSTARKEGNAVLQEKLKHFIGRNQQQWGVSEELISPLGWQSAIFELSGLEHNLTPSSQLNVLTRTVKAIYNEFKHVLLPNLVAQGQVTACIGADDLVPIFMYVFCQSSGNLRHPMRNRDLMWSLCHPDQLHGEGGYYLTVYESSIEYIMNEEINSHSFAYHNNNNGDDEDAAMGRSSSRNSLRNSISGAAAAILSAMAIGSASTINEGNTTKQKNNNSNNDEERDEQLRSRSSSSISSSSSGIHANRIGSITKKQVKIMTNKDNDDDDDDDDAADSRHSMNPIQRDCAAESTDETTLTGNNSSNSSSVGGDFSPTSDTTTLIASATSLSTTTMNKGALSTVKRGNRCKSEDNATTTNTMRITNHNNINYNDCTSVNISSVTVANKQRGNRFKSNSEDSRVNYSSRRDNAATATSGVTNTSSSSCEGSNNIHLIEKLFRSAVSMRTLSLFGNKNMEGDRGSDIISSDGGRGNSKRRSVTVDYSMRESFT